MGFTKSHQSPWHQWADVQCRGELVIKGGGLFVALHLINLGLTIQGLNEKAKKKKRMEVGRATSLKKAKYVTDL